MITCREALSAPGFAAWLVRNYPDYGSLDFNNPADEGIVVRWYLARAVCKEAVPAIRQAYREIFPACPATSGIPVRCRRRRPCRWYRHGSQSARASHRALLA